MNYSRDLMGAAFHPGFRPQLRPKQMLKMGIFGGTYFARRPQDWRELPSDWRKGIEQLLPEKHYDRNRNCFKVRAGLTYREWKSNGWLRSIDPLGWFQWYCRYTLGRRCYDDERQIKRWGSYRRHIGMLVQTCRRRGARIDDASVAPVSRQALLHWAYDPYLKVGALRRRRVSKVLMFIRWETYGRRFPSIDKNAPIPLSQAFRTGSP